MLQHTVVMPLILVKAILTSIVFSYAALCDWKKREINPMIWILPIVVGITLNITLTKYYLGLNPLLQNIDIIKFHILLSLIVSIIIIAISAILSFILSLLGGADVLALATFVSLYPTNLEFIYRVVSGQIYIHNTIFALFFLPPVVIIFSMYLFVMLGLIASNIIHNIVNRDLFKNLEISLQKKIFYVLFGKIVKVRDIVSRKFYYPIYIPNILERITFNINEDYDVWIEKLRKLDPETIIVVTWGTPMVTFIALVILIYISYYTIMTVM